MVDLLLTPDADALTTPNAVRSIYDPTAGTGGMLSVAEDHIRQMNPTAKLTLAGQEINPQSYAICKADMTVKGQPVDAIVFGDTLLNDGHAGATFNYCLSNPPFGVDWKKQQKHVTEEHTLRGYAGRFGPGLPRVSDGSMLFRMHLISKIRPATGTTPGGRAGIVLNGSPLFTGGAGSGESNIRRWVLERDYLEAIIALPTDMFYNTGIATYLWILSTDKHPDRVGKVQLVDGTKLFRKMRKGLGSKRNELSPENIAEIVRLYGANKDENLSKVFPREAFYYRTITVERPLRRNWAVTPDRIEGLLLEKPILKLDPDQQAALRVALDGLGAERVWKNRDTFTYDLKAALKSARLIAPGPVLKTLLSALGEQDDTADVCVDGKGRPEADPTLRDTENVPWDQDVHDYFDKEVRPFAPGAWIDDAKTKEGAEIPFTRHFYEYTPPRPLREIDSDLDIVLGRIRARLEHVKA
jgi:type I restriction enzyme M protein